MADPIRVLVVDEPDAADATAASLEAVSASITADAVHTAGEAIDRLADDDVDCIVSEYDLPGTDGIAFLDAVREASPALPFILLTDAGSEAVASEAISAGVSAYFQKRAAESQDAVLANQIENSVAQHRAERAVERTERRYRRLIEESTDAITVVGESGRYRYLSAAAERLLGYAPSELLGENTFEFIHPDDRPSVAAEFESLVADPDRRVTTTFRFRRADGTWIWLGARGRNLLDDPDIEGIVVYARDSTDRIENRRALRRERDRLSTLFDNFPEPALEYQFVEGEPVVRAVNEAFTGTFGIEPGDAMDAPLNELIVPPEQLAEARSLDEQVRSGERLDVAVQREAADGRREFHLRNIALSGASTADGYAIYSDVTERRTHERKLDQLRERAQVLMYARSAATVAQTAAEVAHEVIGTPMAGFNLLNDAGDALEPVGTIDAAEDIWADPPTYGRDGHPGTPSAVVWEVYEGGDALVLDDTHAHDVFAEPPDVRSLLVYPMGEHGVFILAATRPTAFDETDKSLAEILATFARTAFDRVERETAIRERERRLERQNERLEEFASVVSHDLRNPLNVLIGSLELAEETGDPESFDRAARAVDRMEELIDDLLALARAGETAAEVAPVGLADVVEACWATVETASAQLENVCERSVVADESRLRQLLENLVRNAVEHGGDGVVVTVGDLDDGFYVEDDGAGIPTEDRDRVLESGFSTASNGTGFGLAIVEQIVDAHGWAIHVAVGVAGGARFEITGVDRPG